MRHALIVAAIIGGFVLVVFGGVAGLAWLTTPASQGPGPQGIADQVATVRPAVVHVERKGVCQGSGCVIGAEGLVFTAKHVVEGGPDPNQYTVTTDDGKKHKVQYVIEDTRFDVAFLLLERAKNAAPLLTAPLADIAGMRVGDPLFIMGSPRGFANFNSVSLGILSAMQRDLDATNPPAGYGYGWRITFQSDASAMPGNSGGPVFDMQGRVIGVLVAGMAETVNYSVPVAVFRDNIETVRQAFALMRFQVPGKPRQEQQSYTSAGNPWGYGR